VFWGLLELAKEIKFENTRMDNLYSFKFI
jgi:hypothetical protein